ncbi:glycoside hydrolase family 35 protein [Actinoallomurus sp. CA-142502]|uniref:glycoside hydrolase family 35 protein n=1 Tax=Actinoallomurus sp. CA-142502 TaxID=3239885 RepID=UPI003D8D62D1
MAIRRPLLALVLACLLTTGLLAGPVHAESGAGRHTVGYDRYSLTIDGKRIFLWSGEFHYWRLPSPALWRDVLEKMKAAGFNAVSIYFDWGYHSPRQGVYDFTGVRDVDRLLDIADQVGLYVIARPGPYINAETDSGGFPGWLTTLKGKARSTDPAYLAAANEWLGRIDRILARHQVTDGRGPVLLYQVENELYNVKQSEEESRAYLSALEKKVRSDGITVPFTGANDARFTSGTGAADLEGYTVYPQSFNCAEPGKWKPVPDDYGQYRAGLPDTPVNFAEFQGGAFDQWGGAGHENCRTLTGPDFERVFEEANIAAGATMQNFYMTYGGTNWGWLATDFDYTSYDYGAAIDEARRLTPKYTEQKFLGYLVQSVAPLRTTDPLTTAPPDNTAVRMDARVDPNTGTRFYVVRHADSTSTADDRTHLALDLGAVGRYPSVPSAPGTDLTLAGRDSKLLVAAYRFGGQELVYSTSELMTQGTFAQPSGTGEQNIAVLYGRHGQDGETVLRYASQPKVTVLSGSVRASWDAGRHDLRLDYEHDGLARVLVHGGTRDLLLLIGDDQAAGSFWRVDTSAGPILARGPYLVRGGSVSGRSGEVALTGDTDRAGPLEVFTPQGARSVSWNGRPVRVTPTSSGSLSGELAGPRPVSLPALTNWRYRYETPEAQPGFDDSAWRAADHTTTDNPYWDGKAPVLYPDDYGFHHGDTWYRGHFTATGGQTGITLSATVTDHGAYAVWLNGHYLGSGGDGSKHFDFPASALRPGADNVVSVLAENMGHDQDRAADDSYREPRGLTGAELTGSATTVKWRLQGDQGGEKPADPMRGPYNNGGLYGERAGWYLPGRQDAAWPTVSLPHAEPTPGVGWYRTTFRLNVPKGQDVPVGLRIDDDAARHYRALIFVNGWQVGRYINDVGPQHVFQVPAGILRTDGENTIAIAAWGLDGSGGLGDVSLVREGDYAGPVSDSSR